MEGDQELGFEEVDQLLKDDEDFDAEAFFDVK